MTSLRTCVGCGARAPRSALVRFVLDDATRLRIDPGKSLPGRGAWLHPVTACAQAFADRRGSVRSLRAAPPRAARLALVAEVTRSAPGATGRT